jgi:hypothetical protein
MHASLMSQKRGSSRLRFVAVLLGCMLSVLVLVPVAQAQSPSKPFSRNDIVQLLKGSVPPKRVAELADKRGIDFQITTEAETELRRAGATNELLERLRLLAPKEMTHASPAAGSTYESPDHSISFPTPAGWTVRALDSNGTPYYVLEREGGQEQILAASGSAPGKSIQDIAQQGMQFVTQQMPALRPASMPSYSQINGAPLATISYSGSAQGKQISALHLITLQNGQYFGVLGLSGNDQTQMIQQACQTVIGGVRLTSVRESSQAPSGLIGSWTWFRSTQVGGSVGSDHCSTEKSLAIYPNGRYDTQRPPIAPICQRMWSPPRTFRADTRWLEIP